MKVKLKIGEIVVVIPIYPKNHDRCHDQCRWRRPYSSCHFFSGKLILTRDFKHYRRHPDCLAAEEAAKTKEAK